MSNSKPTKNLFSHLISEHDTDLSVRRMNETNPMDLAVLAALLVPDAARNPQAAFSKAFAFADAINTAWLDLKLKRLLLQKTVSAEAEQYRQAMPLAAARSFPGASEITPPKTYPVDSKKALMLILKEKKSTAQCIEVVNSALAHMKRGGEPGECSESEMLERISKGEVFNLKSDLEFWAFARRIRPFRDKRKLRSKKKVIDANSGG